MCCLPTLYSIYRTELSKSVCVESACDRWSVYGTKSTTVGLCIHRQCYTPTQSSFVVSLVCLSIDDMCSSRCWCHIILTAYGLGAG